MVRQRGPDSFGQNGHKPFAINGRHFTGRLQNRNSQTDCLSLLECRLRGGLVNYRGAFLHRLGTRRNRATLQLTQISDQAFMQRAAPEVDRDKSDGFPRGFFLQKFYEYKEYATNGPPPSPG